MNSPARQKLDNSAVTLAILAGGQGRRMGQGKGTLVIGGRPILQYLHQQMAWAGPTLLVTARSREHPPGFERFDLEVCDEVEGQGPMRGVLTALENSKSDLIVIATVDMPGIGGEQLRWIVARLFDRPDCEGMMLRRAGGAIEPFPFALRRAAMGQISRRLDEKRLAVRSLVEASNFAIVDAPVEWGPDVWVNLNTPEDLRSFKESL